jgi:hypothetical protein
MLGVVLDGALRWTSIVATLLVAAGFAMFAVDQLSHDSRTQVTRIDEAPAGRVTTTKPHHSPVRRAIDTVDKVLLRPFSGLAHSSNAWVQHGVPALLAALIYGLGLAYLARYVRIRG